MASAAAEKKCPRLCQFWSCSPPSNRRYASWTKAVAWSVCPGFSWASLWAANLAQFVVHQREKLHGTLRVTLLDRREDPGHFGHGRRSSPAVHPYHGPDRPRNAVAAGQTGRDRPEGGGTISKRPSSRGDPWTIPVEACAIVGVIPRSAATERVPMPTIPQRIASAFAVLCGRYGDVTTMAKDRDQSRQSLYREAEKVVEAVDGTAAEARVEELRRRLADQEAENRALRDAVGAGRGDHPRQAGRVRRRRPGRGGQPRRRPPALASRGRIEAGPERGDAGAGDPRGRSARRGLARGPRRGGPAPGRAGRRR